MNSLAFFSPSLQGNKQEPQVNERTCERAYAHKLSFCRKKEEKKMN